MTSNPADTAATVDAFIAALCASDLDAALALAADDVVYDNVPMEPVTGHDGVRDVLGGFLAMASEIDWVVHRQVATATTVMNERTDRFRIGEQWLEVEVVGVFEVVNGAITLWRDYFDGKAFDAAMASLGG